MNSAQIQAEIAKQEAQLASLRSNPSSVMNPQALAVLQMRIDALKQQLPAALKLEEEERTAKNQEAQRAGLVTELQGLAKTGGNAYGTTMGQVNRGNSRIGALAASGRGGLNAGINAANAKGLSTSAGHMQGVQAREAAKSGARNALGQVIAQGQDANNAAIQQNINDLRAAYGTPSAANPYATAAAQIGGLTQAGFQAYGNKEKKD